MRKRLQRPAFLRAVQPLNEFSKCCLASLEVDLLVCCVPGGHLDSGKRAIKSTEMHLVPFFHLTEISLVPFSHLSKMTLVPFSRLSEMPSIHFLPNIEDHSFTCCCFTQIQPSFLVNRPRVFWEWDKVVVKMSNIGSLWVIRYAWQLLSNENFDTDISWKQLVDQCEQVIRSSMGVQRGGLGPTARRSHGGGGWVGGGGRPIGLESSNCPEAASPACVLNIINLLEWSTTDKGEQHIFRQKIASWLFWGTST